MKKKLKGFTLVELIIVVAIFGIIMAAVLSILNPISNVYKSTADNEHMRASCDNVRLYVEDNLKYADKLKICYNATQGNASSSANVMINGFIDGSGNHLVGTSDNPIYIMEIDNTNHGFVKIFRFTGSVPADLSGGFYKEINDNLYSDYSYTFNIPANFGLGNAALDIDIEKYIFNAGAKVIPPATDDRYFKMSSKATFSFVNLRNFIGKMPTGTEVKYLTVEGEYLTEDEAKHNPGAIKIDATKPESSPFQGCEDSASGSNIYFIYTLPKFVNQYN